MKKTICAALAAAICASAALCAVGCGETSSDGYTVFAPDGAPALSLCNAIANEPSFDYRVIGASTVQQKVTGRDPEADFCVLPLNLASKLLGSGDTYCMLGTVTNGNLYFLTSGENPALTAENFKSALAGKKVGCVQLTQVPGLTLQVVLQSYGVPYDIVGNAGADESEGKVGLLAVEAADVTPVFGCDYYLCPEPAASAKIKGTANLPKPFRMAGDLQELYGGGNGYPQAVLVVKNEILRQDPSSVEKLLSAFEGSAEYLAAAQPSELLELLQDKRTAELAPAFNANTLTREVVANCSVRFTPAKDCKAQVNAFLGKLIGVNPNAASAVTDAFYYVG